METEILLSFKIDNEDFDLQPNKAIAKMNRDRMFFMLLNN
jgi:hypothetical protein